MTAHVVTQRDDGTSYPVRGGQQGAGSLRYQAAAAGPRARRDRMTNRYPRTTPAKHGRQTEKEDQP
jgi:hypothetical protein